MISTECVDHHAAEPPLVTPPGSASSPAPSTPDTWATPLRLVSQRPAGPEPAWNEYPDDEAEAEDWDEGADLARETGDDTPRDDEPR